MEHEDNNTQMENTQIQSEGGGGTTGSGTGVYDAFGCTLNADNVAGMGNNHGKFDGEHDHDEEWKYIKEGQQSEKQMKQQHNVSNDLFVTANVAEDVFSRNDNSGSAAFADLLAEAGNGAMNFAIKADNIEEEMKKLQNVAFSTKSQAVDDEVMNVVEVKIEEMQQLPHEQYQQEEEHQQQILNEMEEEEPSSLATNTTNGTNSLSENAPPSLLLQQQNNQDKFFEGYDNKENADPVHEADFHLRSNDFDTDLHSQLNPNAREFVPNFGSNPASPTSPMPTKSFDDFEKQHETESKLFSMEQPHPNIASRHLLNDDDDFVAESPRKGRCADMDAISLPAENEFEHEAAKRPHELEQADDLIGDGGALLQLQQQQQHQQKNLPLEELENGNKHENNLLIDGNTVSENVEKYEEESKIQSTGSLIDHGPETSVDQEQDEDVMRRSIYVENVTEPIEDLLNTVQPLPIDIDSLNDSSSEENINLNGAATKELLNVEEKEHVSQSPSIEEFNMNLKNQMTDNYQDNISHASQSTEEMKVHVEHDLHGSIKDIPQLPIDMDNSENMQSSFYIQNVVQAHTPLNANELLMFDTSNTNAEDSVEVARNMNNSESQAVVPPTEDIFLQTQRVLENSANDFYNFEQKFDDFQIKSSDGQLLQEKEIVAVNNENQFFVQENEKYNDIKDENLERQQLLQNEQENLKIENATIDLEAQKNAAQEVAIVPTLDILSKTENQLVEEPIAAETEAVVTGGVITAATAVTAVTVGAVAAVAAVGAAATKSTKKPTAATATTKKQAPGKLSTSTNKSKENDADIKKTIAKPNTAAATKPRTIPAKPAAVTDKKATTAKASTTTAKKPLTSSVNVTKSAPKLTTSSASTKASVAPKTGSNINMTTTNTTTARVSGPTLARKTAGTSAGGTTGAASVTAKTRPSTAPSKPTTLAIPPAAKPKTTSPRANLTTQLRKTASSTTSAKSPTKGLTSTTNGVTNKSTTTSITNARPKSAASTTNTITTTTTTNAFKPFVARPAPKTTNLTVTTTTTTTRRVTTKTSTSTGTAGNQLITTTSSTTQQKPGAVNLKKSPTNKLNTNTGTTVGKLSTNKSPNAGLKAKTKDTKTTTTTTKSSITKNPKTIEEKGSKLIEVETTTIENKINGVAQELQQKQLPNENGVHNLIENGGGNATNGNHLIFDQISPAVDVVADVSLIDA